MIIYLIRASLLFLCFFIQLNTSVQADEEIWSDRTIRINDPFDQAHEEFKHSHPRWKQIHTTRKDFNHGETFFLVHASKQWDKDKLTRPAIDKVANALIKRGGQVVNLRMDSERPTVKEVDFFPAGFNLDDSEIFEGSYHRFRISSPRILVAGGWFAECLACFVNSAIHQSPGTDPLEIIFITDGIYAPVPTEWFTHHGKVVRSENGALMYSHTDFGLLPDRLKFLGDDHFVNDVKNWFTNKGDENCSVRLISDQNLKYEVILGSRKAASFGRTGRKITLKFVTAKEFLQTN